MSVHDVMPVVSQDFKTGLTFGLMMADVMTLSAFIAAPVRARPSPVTDAYALLPMNMINSTGSCNLLSS